MSAITINELHGASLRSTGSIELSRPRWAPSSIRPVRDRLIERPIDRALGRPHVAHWNGAQLTLRLEQSLWVVLMLGFVAMALSFVLTFLV